MLQVHGFTHEQSPIYRLFSGPCIVPALMLFQTQLMNMLTGPFQGSKEDFLFFVRFVFL